MQSHKLFILITTLITISYNSCQAALTCSTGSGASVTCADTVTDCFVKTDATGAVTRGCVTDATCGTASCLTCKSDNCNANLMCKACDGSQPECATSTTFAYDKFNQLCSVAGQQCLSQLNDNGTLSRGCGSPCAADNANCKGCATDNCNVGIFPAERRQCYQCSGASCNDVSGNNASMLMPCATYLATGQKCYTIGTSATTMQRGCSNDAGDGNKCAGATPDASCAFCDTENGCNNRQFESVLGSCYKCNDAAACVAAQTAQPVQCAAANYTQTASCYVQMDASGSVERGCTNERTVPCTDATGCTTCTANGCNAAAAEFQCLVCRSDNYAPCRKAAVAPQPCVNSGQNTATSMKCFEGEWDGVVVRGCLADASPLMIFQCENKDDTRCETCDTVGCNTKSYNGASALQHMGLGMLGLIFIVKQYL